MSGAGDPFCNVMRNMRRVGILSWKTRFDYGRLTVDVDLEKALLDALCGDADDDPDSGEGEEWKEPL